MTFSSILLYFVLSSPALLGLYLKHSNQVTDYDYDYGSHDYSGYEGYEDIKYAFWIFWYPVNLVLVIIVGAIQIVVYRKIAKALDESFWTPVSVPISLIANYLQKCCRPSLNTGANIAVKQTNITDEITAENEQKDNKNVETETNFLSIEHGRERTASVCSIDSEFGSSSNLNHISLKDEWNNKRKRNQRKITSAFFFISFLFIIIAIPTTTIVILCFWLLMYTDADFEAAMFGLFVSQCLYGSVFLLNPFLYMCSNEYVMNKLKCSKRNSGMDKSTIAQNTQTCSSMWE